MWRVVFVACCFSLIGGCATVKKINCSSPYSDLGSLREGDIVHVPSGTRLEKKQLFELLDCARVIYVGESHDNVHSHEVQLEILEALAKRHAGQVAVGVEMLTRRAQETADRWTAGLLDEKTFMQTWLDNWSDDFEYYRPILRYVRDHRIPLVALRAPDDWLSEIKQGESRSAEDAEEGLPSMDVEDPYHRAHTKAVFDNHPKGPGQDFEDFYKIQVLWDESMAKSAVEFLESERGRNRRLLVFTGSQHIQYGYGIPRRVFRRLPVCYAMVLPTVVSSALGKDNGPRLMGGAVPEVPLLITDYIWMVDYGTLDDQKVRLGVAIRDTEDGVVVLGAMKGSTARAAGVEKSDIITGLDGQSVKTRTDLIYLLGLKKPGDKGVLEIRRGAETLHFNITFKAGGFPHHGEETPAPEE